MSTDNPKLGESILAQLTRARTAFPLGRTDSIRDEVSLPETSRPAGSVALDFTCDVHGGRLVRLWMSPQAGYATIGGEGRSGALDTDPSASDGVVVRCTRQGCHNSARLSGDWLVAHLAQVRANFEAGRGLPIAWFPLSQVGSQVGPSSR